MATITTSPGTSFRHGVEFPVPGTWVLDPAHTTIEFEARHLMVAKVRGHFGEFEGVIHVAEDPAASSAEVTIKAASIDTRVQQRDDHLRSPDFLDAAGHPELTFRSTAFEHVGEGDWRLRGDLTIRGVTREVVLDTEYSGTGTDPWGGTRAFFSATTTIDREQWGLTWNQALESGGWLVSRELKLALEVEATLQS